jgi:hypothetical protein
LFNSHAKGNNVYKPLTVLTLCLLSISLAACIQAPVAVPDAQAAYCEDLKTFRQAVEDVKALPDDATVEDVETAMEVADEAYDELRSSAWELADAQTAALEDQYDEMRNAVDTITDETTLVEARTVISTSVEAYKSTFDEVMGVSCPGE